MMEQFSLLRDQMRHYVNRTLSGNEIVKTIDDFVASDYVYNVPENLYEKIMALQDKVALYVSDSEMRKEHGSYFGDDQLRTLIMQFLKETSM